MLKGEERRKYVRISLPDGQAKLVSGILNVLVGKIVDISIGGLKFVCSSEFNIGDNIDVDVMLASGLKLKCVAKISRMESAGNNAGESVYGAQFVNLGDKEKIELAEYLMKLDNKF